MTFEIDINGRTRTVSIERRSEGKYRVLLDGTPHDLAAARVGVYGLSMLLDGEAGVSREVQVAPGSARGELLVTLTGRTVAATVNGCRTGRAGADAGGGCPSYYADLQSGANQFRTLMRRAIDDARRANVLPGTARDLLRTNRLEFDWER